MQAGTFVKSPDAAEHLMQFITILYYYSRVIRVFPNPAITEVEPVPLRAFSVFPVAVKITARQDVFTYHR